MKKPKIILLLILLGAAILRIWGLDRVPPELFGDELDVGYHAYSLLKTGRDYYGQFLPTYIHSFSEWRAPLLMYVTTPFIFLFGLNEWGVRLPSAVFGVLTILLLYKIVKILFDKESVAVLSALILTVSPWHIQYSRAAFEVSLLLFLILLGTYFFLESFRKPALLLFSALTFALTFYTYSTANIFIPLFLIILVVLNKQVLRKVGLNYVLASGLVFLVLIIPILYSIFYGSAADRFNKFSIFSDESIISEINLKRSQGNVSIIELLFHNKPLYWGKKILTNYMTAFSPQFLFIDGDITFRHSIHEVGEFFWITLPFLIIGFYSLVKLKSKSSIFVLLWLAISPIPSSLTRDGTVHATRLILMLPVLVTIAAVGTEVFLQSNFKRRNFLVAFFIGVFLIEFALYTHRYLVHYPKESWRWWHYGYKEAMVYMKSQEGGFEKIVFNNTYEPALIRFLFWWRDPPQKFLNEFISDKEIENVIPGLNGFSLGQKYYFGTAKEAPGGVDEFVKKGMLYLVSQRDEVGGDWDWEKNPPGGIKVLKTIRNPYMEPIFYIVTSDRT